MDIKKENVKIPSEISGISRIYITNYTGISQLAAWLNTADFTDKNSSGLFSTNPSQYILSVDYYPIDLNDAGILGLSTTPDVYIGDATYTVGSFHKFYRSTVAGGYDLLDCGSIDLTKLTKNDYVNYAPFSRAQIFLPMCGFNDIDIDIIVGHSVKVYLAIDFDSGKGTYYLDRDDNTLIMIKDCKIGIDIPIGSSNANEKARNNLMIGLTALTGLGGSLIAGLANPVAGVMAGIGTAVSTIKGAINANVTDFKAGTTSGGNAALFSPTKPTIRIYTKNVNMTYKNVIGVPVDIACPMAQVQEDYFFQISECHLENVTGALSNELDEIETLLKKGVIR